jgi:uncharacterized protein YkwD
MFPPEYRPPKSAMLRQRAYRWALFAGAAVLLAALPPATAQGVGVDAPQCGPGNLAAEALARLNALRALGADCRSHGRFGRADPLVWSPVLTQSAQSHAQDMAARDYLSHVSPGGLTLPDRIDMTGYRWRSLGEDIAGGYLDLDSVLPAWMASDSHCATLMNPRLSEVGLACVAGTRRSLYRTYWTMDLGRPR